jgi:citrate synthase
MATALPRLTAAQAAARLGVKPQTLYAYVSRGLLSRERDVHGSTFDPLEIEAFADARRAGAARQAAPPAAGSPLMVLDTDVARIEDGELYFRGLPAADLVRDHSFEQVARWLWRRLGDELGGDAGGGEPDDIAAGDPAGSPRPDVSGALFAPDLDAVASARTALAALPSSARTLDRLQVAVPMLGAADPTRHDLGPDAVRGAAERLIAGVVAALATERRGPRTGIAAALWHALAGRRPTASEAGVLDAALVLLADHDLATSTLAARAAASARATPYAVVSSGLGALDSALHGNASEAASGLIRLVLDGADARTAIAQTVARTARPVPGFGQPLYPNIDARAGILLPLIARNLPGGSRVIGAVDSLAAQVEERTHRHPNVDLALAALTIAAGMPSDAGPAIFAVSRMVGWIAHALDEYEQRPLRLRPRGRYVGPGA